MEVKVAKTAGFCFGVKRAVDMVYEQVGKGQKVYTYGPIIHNEEVVNDLAKKGVQILETEEELAQAADGILIIRSHGVPKRIYDLLQEKQIRYIDATCPFVLRIHKIVREESEKGRQIFIIGNDGHPEVEGIKGWCTKKAFVISDSSAAKQLQPEKNEWICVVSQTTFNYKNFQEIVEILNEKGYDKIVFNTICNATAERQVEAASIAKSVDAMLVIGGKHSSNTKKLYEICKKECVNTYYIQTLVDLDSNMFRSNSCVGITAGASTPNNIIEEVQKHVRIKF